MVFSSRGAIMLVKITDPEEIKKLESMKSVKKKSEEIPSKEFESADFSGLLGPVEAVGNIFGLSKQPAQMTSMGSFSVGVQDKLLDALNKSIQTLAGEEYLARAPRGQGPAYELGGVAGEIGSYMIPGAAISKGIRYGSKLPYVGKAFEALGGASYAPTAARNISGGAGAGYLLNPENNIEGAQQGALWSTLGEAIPGAARGLGHVYGEAVSRSKYAQSLMNKMKEHFDQTKSKASELYSGVLEKYGHQKVTVPRKKSSGEIVEPEIDYVNYVNNPQEGLSAFQYYGPAERRMHKQYLSNPTLENAHKLQSQLGSEIRDLSLSDFDTRTARNLLEESRQKLLGDISRFLGKRSNQALSQYKEGQSLYAKELSPYLSEKSLGNIVEGITSKMTPKKLQSTIQSAKEKRSIPSNHLLNQYLEDLNKNLSRAKVWDVATGSLPLRKLGFDLSSIASNEEVAKALAKAEKIYRPAVKAGVATQIQKEER